MYRKCRKQKVVYLLQPQGTFPGISLQASSPLAFSSRTSEMTLTCEMSVCFTAMSDPDPSVTVSLLWRCFNHIYSSGSITLNKGHCCTWRHFHSFFRAFLFPKQWEVFFLFSCSLKFLSQKRTPTFQLNQSASTVWIAATEITWHIEE